MEKEIKKIIDQIVKNYQPQKIILFGSRAKGKLKTSSDIEKIL